jgi:DNA polymerase I
MAKISWKEALAIERDVAIIIQEQEEHGVYFNTDKALELIDDLEARKEEKYKEIRPYLNYQVIKNETKDSDGNYNFVRKVRNKDGSFNKSILNWYDDPDIVDGPFSRISIEEPSISKRQLVIDELLRRGWKPTLFTDKGFPKLTDKGEPVDTLADVGDFGKELSLWYVYSHRQSQIRGFLPHVRDDHRIPAGMDTCATNTFRAAHRVVANIPRPTSTYGKEMRSLFTVAPGRVFVGADASGLELRMLAHHMRDEEYINQILTGDIHTYNQLKAGLPTRDQAKTFI